MIAKEWVGNDDVERLEALRTANPKRAKDVDEEIRKRRVGQAGERQAAHYIDAELGVSRNYAVIHGLRLETPVGPAQFDHVVVGRLQHFTILETKSFRDGVKVTDEGEFLRWDSYRRRYEAMESPLMQCGRHETALLAYLGEHDVMPRRLGMAIKPVVRSLVLVNPEAKVIRPSGYDTSRVVKADQFFERMLKEGEPKGFADSVGQMARVLSADTIAELARKLVAGDSPIVMDLAGMLGLFPVPAVAEPTPVPVPTVDAAARDSRACSTCGSHKGEIRYGYGYYWKCLSCGANGKLPLRKDERLRKSGAEFFLVAADGTETPFHVNAAPVLG